MRSPPKRHVPGVLLGPSLGILRLDETRVYSITEDARCRFSLLVRKAKSRPKRLVAHRLAHDVSEAAVLIARAHAILTRHCRKWAMTVENRRCPNSVHPEFRSRKLVCLG